MRSNLDHPFYYLKNFAFVLDWVALRYRDLLNAEENAFIATFSTLPEKSCALLVRMVMRKGDLFRDSKLSYDEIGPTGQAVQALIELGWVTANPILTLDELYGLLTRKEFADCLGLAANKNARKGELYQTAVGLALPAQPFSAWCAALDDRAYRICVGPLCDRIRLMFFGNLYQDWSEFILSDLGVFTYEKVEFSTASRAFHTRDDIDLYLHYHNCRERFHATQADSAASDTAPESLLDIERDIVAPACDNPWLRERRSRLLFQIAQRHEQLGDADSALRLYAQCDYPGARLRRIRVLEKSQQVAASMALAQEAWAAPENAAESQQLLRVMPRLRRKLCQARGESAARWTIPRLDVVLPKPVEPTYVEEVARLHVATTDPASQVIYVENALINSLFGLLCWDAIFHALPGAFFHPFQSGPADLHGADFVKLRKELFEACLRQLETQQYLETIRRNFVRKAGIQSPFVYWSVLDEELLETALHCIPAAHLARWCDRILQDIPANRSGFPDLIQFWPQEQRYRLIEVKGPGDRLQDNQLRLIDFALSHQMPLAVCYVAWEGET
ncbi:MAG TPA: VRR-NUC domain-containing protein [Burkholderiaceae bacterium]